jgi:putative nucleotidyltransferase with HDIG domain
VIVSKEEPKQEVEQELAVVKWAGMLWRKYPETYQHGVRVSILAEKISVQLKLEARDRANLIRGCFLHDIGKAMIPRELILRSAPLTRVQWNTLKMHPVLGAEIAASSDGLSEDIVNLIRYHHERWDGRGYPEGLSGEQIPFLARICAVVDAFDSMLSDRPYGKRKTASEAKLELLRHAGKQFDPDVVHAFMTLKDDIVSVYSV